MRRPSALFVLLSALFSSACSDDGVRISYSNVLPRYNRAELFNAADGRDMPTAVVGNPFGTRQEVFEATVTRVMNGVPIGPRTRFTTTPNETARGNFRVVMLFNPAANVSSELMCTNPDPAPTPGMGTAPGAVNTDRLNLQSAFCQGGVLFSSAYGWADRVQGPDDPRFARLIQRIMLATFPPNRNDEACLVPFRRTC